MGLCFQVDVHQGLVMEKVSSLLIIQKSLCWKPACQGRGSLFDGTDFLESIHVCIYVCMGVCMESIEDQYL